jgi:hypothetical protein
VVEGRVRRVERLVDRQPPRGGAHEDRRDVEAEREHDPRPVDEVERVVDDVPVRPAPPEQRDHATEHRKDERDLERAVVAQVLDHAATVAGASSPEAAA